MTSTKRSTRGFWGLRTWRGRLAWGAGVLIVAAGVCWMLARMTPGWYAPFDPTDDGVIQAADVGKSRVAELWNSVERVPRGPQRWTITEDEVNALLATDPLLTYGSEPSESEAANLPFSDPYVIFEKGQVTVCARVRKLPSGDPQGGVGSLSFSVGIVPGSDGKAVGQVKLTRAWIGKLPVPASLVEPRIRALLPTLREAARLGVQMQRGTRDEEKLGGIMDGLIDSVITGRPFPLQYTIDRKEFLIQEMRVGERTFTVVLAPVKAPAAAPARPAPR